MDVMNVEQAKIAEEAGAAAVMALERIPANIRRDGGVARMVSADTAFLILSPRFCRRATRQSQYQAEHQSVSFLPIPLPPSTIVDLCPPRPAALSVDP